MPFEPVTRPVVVPSTRLRDVDVLEPVPVKRRGVLVEPAVVPVSVWGEFPHPEVVPRTTVVKFYNLEPRFVTRELPVTLPKVVPMTRLEFVPRFDYWGRVF